MMLCLKTLYILVQIASINYTFNKSHLNSFILLVFPHVANFKYVANFRFLTLAAVVSDISICRYDHTLAACFVKLKNRQSAPERGFKQQLLLQYKWGYK